MQHVKTGLFTSDSTKNYDKEPHQFGTEVYYIPKCTAFPKKLIGDSVLAILATIEFRIFLSSCLSPET
jgi:hypothetical protein